MNVCVSQVGSQTSSAGSISTGHGEWNYGHVMQHRIEEELKKRTVYCGFPKTLQCDGLQALLLDWLALRV